MIKPGCHTCPYHQSPDWCSRISHGLSCIVAKPGESVFVSEELMREAVRSWRVPLRYDGAKNYKPPVGMTPKFYPLLTECIEVGLELGWNRAHKHTDAPTREAILDEQQTAIMGQICEWFDLPEEG